jgi:hypothetical protein
MRPEATLLIAEWVLADGPHHDPLGKLMDLAMLLVTPDPALPGFLAGTR